MTLLQIAGNVEAALSLVIAGVIIVRYWRRTRGAWRQNALGRIFMALMLVIGAVLVLSVVRFVTVDLLHWSDPDWFYGLRVFVFAGVPFVLLRLSRAIDHLLTPVSPTERG